MAVQQDLIKKISEAVDQSAQSEYDIKEIYTDPSTVVGKNEFLFFIKPEVLDRKGGVDVDAVLELILGKIDEFGLVIHNAKVLSANYLEQHDIIAQHYGVINKIARDAANSLSESAQEKFEELYGTKVSDVKLIGGLEVLDQYPAFNAFSLDYLWQNLENKKLAGGTYVEKIKLDNETLYVVNGFHPRQLKHFTAEGRSIVVMTLSGDLDWSVARNAFTGATNPANAAAGSIRRSLLDNKDKLGLAEVGQGTNGVHLSAGPVEALVELRRYNSDFSATNGEKQFTDFSFGKALEATLGDKLEQVTDNIDVVVDGKTTSIFDLTEEKNSDEALAILKEVLGS